MTTERSVYRAAHQAVDPKLPAVDPAKIDHDKGFSLNIKALAVLHRRCAAAGLHGRVDAVALIASALVMSPTSRMAGRAT